jgi:hypothetical protein
MSEQRPTPCRHAPPPDAAAWSLEVAAALEALDHEGLCLRLEDGTLLEPDNEAESVVLLALRARGCELELEDVEQACLDLAELETEAGLETDEDYGRSLPGVAWRYLLAHSTLGVLPELPDPALVDAVIEQARDLVGDR